MPLAHVIVCACVCSGLYLFCSSWVAFKLLPACQSCICLSDPAQGELRRARRPPGGTGTGTGPGGVEQLRG